MINPSNVTNAMYGDAMFKKKLSFKLIMPEVQPFMDGPEPEEVSIPLLGHKATVKKKDEVYKNACIAVHPEARRGDAHAAMDGVVTDITARYITIKKQEVSNSASPRPEPVSLEGLEGAELGKVLKSLGLGMREFNKPGDHIIINAFNPEPGIYWAGGMLVNDMDALKAGMDLVLRLMKPSQISVVLPQDANLDSINFGENVRHFYAKPEYPNSMAPLVAKTVTQKEYPANVSVLSLHSLWRYGQVAASGLPALTTVMTVQGKNLRVLTGTPMRALLAHVDVFPQDGDFVILGGYMRGAAVADLDMPVGSFNYGVFHVPQDDYAPVRENPCINCGACVLYCPAHLVPNKISRYAEFQNYDECQNFGVEACMDCGMCSFMCLARRPMLQYMREARKYIEQKRTDQLPMSQA